jgi:hypothetical protein
MKKFAITLVGILLLTSTGIAMALQAKGWRLVIEQSIANDTPVVISEIEWLGYAVYSIDSVSTGSGGTFSFKATGVGDVTDQFPEDATFTVSDSTGNDGTYTVASSSYDSGTNVTTVTVADDESIDSATADGTITTDDYVDGTRSDLGESACGWTRTVSNLTGTKQTDIDIPCDSVNTNRLRESTLIPSGIRRTRLGYLMFDDNFADSYTTRRVINSSNGLWIIQYTWYVGSSAPNRVLPDIEAYSVTVPNAYVGPGENGYAPSIWTVQYQDMNTGRWVNIADADQSAVNFNNGSSVDAAGETVASGSVGKKLTFVLP